MPQRFGNSAGLICLVLLSAFIGAVAMFFGMSARENYRPSNSDNEIEAVLLETVQKTNSQLPVMIDPDTRFDTALCVGKQVHYKYTLVRLLEREIDKEEFRDRLSRGLTRSMLADEGMVAILSKGVEYLYMYFDREGTPIATITISEKNLALE